MNLSYTVKRIRKTNFSEITFRAKKYLADSFDKVNYKNESQKVHRMDYVFWANQDVDLSQLAKKSLNSENRIWQRQFFTDGWNRQETVDFFKKQYPEEFKKSIERAEGMMQNKFKFLGIEIEYPDGIDWHKDPMSDFRYDLVYHKEINIFSGHTEQGDIKHIWEVNRHQFLIELGKAYYLTGDEKYARKVVDIFRDWYEKNPYKFGVNWTSALEIAVRSFAWIWAFSFIKDSKHFTGKINFLLQKALYMHSCYLSQNLSFFFSPYNHLVGEVSALFLINYLFPQFKNSAKLAEEAWVVLEDEVKKQFHSDGMTVEQASYYHHFTLGFYLQTFLLRKINNDSVSDSLAGRLEKAAEFMMYLTRPDGSIPRIGDIDDGLAIYFSDAADWDFRSFLNMGAILFNRPDMKCIGSRFQENAFWLLGKKGYQDYQSIDSQVPDQSKRYFEDSGYLVIRNSWGSDADYCMMDAGPLAAGVHHDSILSAAHGHMDFSSMELHLKGKPLLVDGGFYTYNGPLEWAQYFRLTEAHNTLTVDNQSQAVTKGRMKISNAPNYRILNRHEEESLFTFSVGHDGYERLEDPVYHERTLIRLFQKFWLVLDKAEGRQSHRLALHYHLHPEAQVKNIENNIATINHSGDSFKLSVLTPQLESACARGQENPEGGWIGENYGLKHPADYLKFENEVQLPAYLVSLIYAEDSDKRIKINRISDDNITCFSLENSFGLAFLYLNPGEFSFNKQKIKTDAEVVIAIQRSEKQKNRLFTWHLSRLEINGEKPADHPDKKFFKTFTVSK